MPLRRSLVEIITMVDAFLPRAGPVGPASDVPVRQISSSLGNRNENSNFFKGTSVKKLDVQSTTLDAELDEIPADVIKLDIEGAEPLAVQGMNKIIQKGHPLVLFAEINPSALTSLGSSPELLIRSLRNLGFDVYFIDESKRGLIPLSENSAISKGNLYCKLGDSR